MVDLDRRPTAQEIEELIDLVRRDPASPAFIDLAEAYLALGRPKDAIKVSTMGLEASPDRLEGRVVLARSFAAMHMWKEAQGELLRVVKIDRSNRSGFALLGEVLLRRNDFERAVPVLQHAQNLDPTSPHILTMLKRARQGQPLDPPRPVPQAIPPRGETNYGLSLDEAMPAPAPPAPRPPAPVPSASPVAPTMAIQPVLDDRPDSTLPSSQPMGGWAEPPPRAPKKPTAPPPMSVEGVRPRVISGAKPQNAAAASLRQSAAVGENYLNDLLTGGLLDVAGVRVPDSDFDLRPDRRWGRSTRRAFIFLFVVLLFGIGGGGTWYWWTEKQKSEAVARLQKEAKESVGSGDFASLEASIQKLSDALDKDNSNLLTFAYVAEATGLEALLYGTDDQRVDQAIKAVAKDIAAGQPGARELVIGKAAVELSRLATIEAPTTMLAEVRKMLDEHLAKHEDDRWARWLKARALLAAGERKAAKATLEAAAAGDDGLVVAMIDQADLLVDEGALDEAFALYDRALASAKDHPLAVLGKSLARAESTLDPDAAIGDLSVKLDKNFGPRVTAYRNLALALAESSIEAYPSSAASLTKATASKPPAEPRFWARVAWLHYLRADFVNLALVRDSKKIAWFGKTKAEDDPAVQLVDAAIWMATGEPDKALDVASKLAGIRPQLLRAQALLDLRKPKDALGELDAILEKAPDHVEAQILREYARMLAGPDKERAAAAESLERLIRSKKSKLGRHALGMGHFYAGKAAEARAQLEQAVANLDDEHPNPLAYRSYTALAELALRADDAAAAAKHLEAALAANSGYFPARVLQAKLELKGGDVGKALALLEPLVKEGAATPDVQLLFAEAQCTRKDTSAKHKEQAQAILEAIKDKVSSREEAGRVAAACDPELPEQLGLPAPGSAPSAAPPKRGGTRPGRRRR
jgi:predicted Zn-dependent protease